MAPDNNGSYEVNLEFPNNTGPVLEGLEQVAGVVKDSRDDIKAFNDALVDTIGKASQIKEFFTGSVDQVEKMKSILEITSTLIQGNQSLLSNNLTAINEIISSVKGMGGNIGQAMSVLGLAGAPIQNIMSGNAPTASEDFSYMGNNLDNKFEQIDNIELPHIKLRGFFGAEKNKKNKKSNEDEDEDILTKGQVSGPPIGDGVNKRPASTARRRQLEQDYPNIEKRIPIGREGRSAEIAYGTMRNKLDDTLGTTGLGGYFNKQFTKILSLNGIDPKSIRAAQRENVEPTGLFDQYGNPIYSPKDQFSDTEAKTMKTVDKILSHMEVGIGAAVMKSAGYLNVGIEAYNMLHDVTKFIRPLAQYAQQQGQLMGKVNYAQTAGNALTDFISSGFDLNPFYSFSDIAASRNNAYALGFRGNNVNQYMGIASQFKQQYGLSQNQTMQMIGGGLSVGVNQNDTSTYYGRVANLINTTQTSSQYAQQAYLQGMQQASLYGANSSAAAGIGVFSAQFGAGNFIAQAAGMTGNELMGTQLGTALMAQQLGTDYLGVFAAEQKMSGTAIEKMSDESIITLLSNSFGINNQTIKKERDLDQYATLLSMVLPQLGIDPKKVGTPKQAKAYVWLLLQRYKHESSKHGLTALKDLNTAQTLVNKLDKQVKQAGGERIGRQILGSTAPIPQTGADIAAHDALNNATTANNAGMTGNTKLEIKLHPSVQHLLTAVINSSKGSSTNGSQPVNTLGK